jgi:hypothetical protein
VRIGEVAMNRARDYSKDFIDEEQINDSYATDITNGELFLDEEKGSVSMETVLSDEQQRD